MTWLERWSRRGLGREGAERVSAGCYGSIVAASTLAGSAAVPPGSWRCWWSRRIWFTSAPTCSHTPSATPTWKASICSRSPPTTRGLPLRWSARRSFPRRCAGVGGPWRGSPAGHQYRRDHGGRAVGRCGTSRRLSAWGAWLGTGSAHRCDPGDDCGACPREALAHALTRALARPTSDWLLLRRWAGSTMRLVHPARRRPNRTAGGGPRAAAGWWRVTHRRRPDPTTHATNRLTRRPAWTCWVIAQDPVCPAHPPCRLRRAHHQHADRGHAPDADLDRNRPPGTALSGQKTPA